ncbi:hypothetical protein BDW_09235 [Bdellovibrio bacteriovorus W]|nr:hypothetical protein BDW_09235 [Bdellovibrio bacteriovorus W]
MEQFLKANLIFLFYNAETMISFKKCRQNDFFLKDLVFIFALNVN